MSTIYFEEKKKTKSVTFLNLAKKNLLEAVKHTCKFMNNFKKISIN